MRPRSSPRPPRRCGAGLRGALALVAPPVLWWLLLLAVAVPVGCAASRHPTTPAALGEPVSSDAMLAVLAEPGPIRFEKVVVADWAVELGGLLNLDHPTARAAGLADREEPIHLYLYALHHPTAGTWIVDSGIEAGFRAPGSSERVGFLLRRAMKTEKIRVHVTTAEWLERSGGRLDGVLLTHLHLDHILGLPEVPAEVPVYTGPGETGASAFLNVFTRGTIDRMLEGVGPLREWGFEPDPAGRFDGVIDVFGDGSLFALHVPGHSPGSTAFAVRTTDGPVLLLGDASHTVWGWENGVEPGSFSLDRPRSAESLAHLRALAAAVPTMAVHPGHQSAPRDAGAAPAVGGASGDRGGPRERGRGGALAAHRAAASH